MATAGTRSAAPTTAARLTGLVALMLVLAAMLAPAASAVGSPDLTITKTSDAVGTLTIGDRFTYTLTVSNVGSATAHDVVVSDDFPTGVGPVGVIVQLPGGTCTFASSQTPGSPPANSLYCELDPMDAGAVVTIPLEVELDHYVHCGALKNTAKVRSTGEPAIDRDNNSSSVTDDVACVPSINVETTAPTYAHAGASVPFTMRVHNDGQTSLGSVDLLGPGCSPKRIGNGNGDAVLAVGENWTFRCSRHIDGVQDRLTGTATVVAYSATEQKVSARDSASVRVLDPGIAITVEPSPVSGTPGDTITYTYVVSNTGDAALTDISVDDDRLGHIGDIAQLQPGHDATLHATRTLSATDVWVINTATAEGTDAGGRSVSASDGTSVTIVAAGNGGQGGHGGTAFTGLDATPAAALAIALGLVGAALLAAGRRRA
jgi:uncharacterized repeat protein (TIGR01451 family)